MNKETLSFSCCSANKKSQMIVDKTHKKSRITQESGLGHADDAWSSSPGEQQKEQMKKDKTYYGLSILGLMVQLDSLQI